MGGRTVGEKIHETGGLHEKHNMLEALAIQEWNKHTFREADCTERHEKCNVVLTRRLKHYLMNKRNTAAAA